MGGLAGRATDRGALPKRGAARSAGVKEGKKKGWGESCQCAARRGDGRTPSRETDREDRCDGDECERERDDRDDDLGANDHWGKVAEQWICACSRSSNSKSHRNRSRRTISCSCPPWNCRTSSTR